MDNGDNLRTYMTYGELGVQGKSSLLRVEGPRGLKVQEGAEFVEFRDFKA